jgi:hypothetical protein
MAASGPVNGVSVDVIGQQTYCGCEDRLVDRNMSFFKI